MKKPRAKVKCLEGIKNYWSRPCKKDTSSTLEGKKRGGFYIIYFLIMIYFLKHLGLKGHLFKGEQSVLPKRYQMLYLRLRCINPPTSGQIIRRCCLLPAAFQFLYCRGRESLIFLSKYIHMHGLSELKGSKCILFQWDWIPDLRAVAKYNRVMFRHWCFLALPSLSLSPATSPPSWVYPTAKEIHYITSNLSAVYITHKT